MRGNRELDVTLLPRHDRHIRWHGRVQLVRVTRQVAQHEMCTSRALGVLASVHCRQPLEADASIHDRWRSAVASWFVFTHWQLRILPQWQLSRTTTDYDAGEVGRNTQYGENEAQRVVLSRNGFHPPRDKREDA